MPKCDKCGFAHAQSDRCINCGSTDPLRRHRLIKLIMTTALVLIGIALAVYFSGRYAQIERSVRQAEINAAVPGDVLAPKPAGP
jgi:hypothetical protein